MLHIRRIWKKRSSSAQQSILWEMGDEQWEQMSQDFRHYRVISRQKVQEEIHELLLLLPETPIPLEALSRHLTGSEWIWEDSEELIEQVSLLQQTNQSKKVSILPQAVESFEDQTYHAQQTQLTQELQATEFSLPSYILPTELWCSLSQWIPASALFQPSLHLQAASELSDIPTPTSPVQSKRDTYSRPVQALHQHAKRGQQTMHGRLHTHSQPFQAQFEKPLFI